MDLREREGQRDYGLDIVGSVYHLVIYICSPTRYTMRS